MGQWSALPAARQRANAEDQGDGDRELMSSPAAVALEILVGRWVASLDYTRVIHEPTLCKTMSSTLTDQAYHQLAQQALQSIEAQVDRWLDDDVVDIDTHRSGGLLELSLPGGSKLIINTQPPLQEIWLAARGGGFHFRHVDGAWRDTRDGVDFFERVSEHLSLQSGQALRLKSPQV